jgi:hypothetical protein
LKLAFVGATGNYAPFRHLLIAHNGAGFWLSLQTAVCAPLVHELFRVTATPQAATV